MTFIREKKISGQTYAYLVKTQHTTKGPRQKVVKYLGKIHSMQCDNVTGTTPVHVLESLLINLGFIKKRVWENGLYTVSLRTGEVLYKKNRV